jgi:replication-associated recombination protein RarA
MGEVASAMQKAIRRGDGRMGGYWAIELFESGFHAYAWRRLMTISAEDTWGIITKEVWALWQAFQEINKHGFKNKTRGRLFLAKAVLLLAAAKKSRDADHLANLVWDPAAVDDDTLERELDEARKDREEIPEYAFDVHTARGRAAGKTKTDFFIDEFETLANRQPGLFDGDWAELKAGRRKYGRVEKTKKGE